MRPVPGSMVFLSACQEVQAWRFIYSSHCKLLRFSFYKATEWIMMTVAAVGRTSKRNKKSKQREEEAQERKKEKERKRLSRIYP